MTDNSHGVTRTYSEKDAQLNRKKWASKQERDLVAEVRDRFSEYQRWRSSSCPLYVPRQIYYDSADQDGLGAGGGDWRTRWQQDYRNWAMVPELLRTASNRSNLKSPLVFSPVEAAIAEFQESNQSVVLSPTEEVDRVKVRMRQQLLRHLENKGDFSIHKATTFRETVICGTSFAKACWIKVVRDVETVLTSDYARQEIERLSTIEGNEEQMAKLKDQLDKGKPATKKEKIIEYNDIAYIPVSVFEVYPDPSARCLRGPSHEAGDFFWRTFMSIEQARKLFNTSADSYFKKSNIGRVVSAHEAAESYAGNKAIFTIPSDMANPDQVEVIRYYNKLTDKYIIIANDVLVRDGPLPYNHKQIPFVSHKLIDIPYNFYGMGFGSILEPMLAHDETLMNMDIEQRKMNLGRPIFMHEDLAPDFNQQYDYIEPNQVVVTSQPLSDGMMKYMEAIPVVDYMQARSMIREDSVQTTGINPMSYAMPRPGEPVRNNMMSMESTLKMLKKGIKGWAHGYKEFTRQALSLMTQYYPEEYVHSITDPDGNENSFAEKQRPNSVRVEGYRFDEVGGELQETKIEGESFLQLKKEYLDLTGDVDIEIDTDTLIPVSQSLKLQNLTQAITQMIPIVSNPQVLNAPGILPLVREYLESIGVSSAVTDQLEDTSTDDDVVNAQMQEQKMMAGEQVPGVPGESEKHKFQHLTTLLGLKQVLDKPDQVPPEQLLEAQMLYETLYQHFQLDHMQKNEVGAAGLQLAAPPPPPKPPGPPMGMPPEAAMGMMGEQGMMPPQDMPMNAVPMANPGGMM